MAAILERGVFIYTTQAIVHSLQRPILSFSIVSRSDQRRNSVQNGKMFRQKHLENHTREEKNPFIAYKIIDD